jgi:hypothetical protein
MIVSGEVSRDCKLQAVHIVCVITCSCRMSGMPVMKLCVSIPVSLSFKMTKRPWTCLCTCRSDPKGHRLAITVSSFSLPTATSTYCNSTCTGRIPTRWLWREAKGRIFVTVLKDPHAGTTISLTMMRAQNPDRYGLNQMLSPGLLRLKMMRRSLPDTRLILCSRSILEVIFLQPAQTLLVSQSTNFVALCIQVFTWSREVTGAHMALSLPQRNPHRSLKQWQVRVRRCKPQMWHLKMETKSGRFLP